MNKIQILIYRDNRVTVSKTDGLLYSMDSFIFLYWPNVNWTRIASGSESANNFRKVSGSWIYSKAVKLCVRRVKAERCGKAIFSPLNFFLEDIKGRGFCTGS